MLVRGSSKRTRATIGVFVAVLSCVLVGAGIAHAQVQSEALTAFGSATRLSATPLPIVIARLIRAFIGILGILSVVIILFAGFRYMTAAGDQEKVARAKRMLVQAAVGLAIILSSFVITQFVLNALLRSAGLSGGITRTADAFIEPLSGSLGAGIVQDHYPPRNALEIPRNVRAFVTFKEAIDPSSVSADTVKVFPTAQGDGAALPAAELAVTFDDANRTFVFDPVPLLGSATEDTNYTVSLTPGIRLANGRNAFTGTNAAGYEWTFEVSTEVDLTPPRVVSVVPVSGTHAPNTAISITFDEAMDPVGSTGRLEASVGKAFDHLSVLAGSPEAPVEGEYRIGNAYRTVEFVPLVPCAQDACGDTVFCLPFGADVRLEAHAATLSTEPPQARLFGASFDGITDASGNSLDGDGDRVAEGKGTDDFASDSFRTGTSVDDRTPAIAAILPKVLEGNVPVDQDVQIEFTMPMMSTSLHTGNVQVWPDPIYEMSFFTTSEALPATGATRSLIHHPTFLPPDVDCDGDQGNGLQACFYYPLVTKDVKGINQFCLYPALGPDAGDPSGTCQANETAPFCCDGRPSASACDTVRGQVLPPTP